LKKPALRAFLFCSLAKTDCRLYLIELSLRVLSKRPWIVEASHQITSGGTGIAGIPLKIHGLDVNQAIAGIGTDSAHFETQFD
jgi:hypothetical protein